MVVQPWAEELSMALVVVEWSQVVSSRFGFLANNVGWHSERLSVGGRITVAEWGVDLHLWYTTVSTSFNLGCSRAWWRAKQENFAMFFFLKNRGFRVVGVGMPWVWKTCGGEGFLSVVFCLAWSWSSLCAPVV